ncbi:MAG: chromosome segregation protein [Actinophytocola sp.]|nr:chromosome segregation protein [Actinophytocola sp.]
MSLGEEQDLVPLGAGFDVVRRGYSPSQVNEHLERLDADLKMLTSDRDAAISQAGDLARQLEVARTDINNLKNEIETLSLPPTELEGLSARLRRMLRRAQDEASETTARAEAEASHIRAKAEADATAMRTRYDQLLADLDTRRQEMEQEHREAMDKARAEAQGVLNRAQEERLRLDLEAEERRTKVEEDFEIAMATRRTESMRQLAEQEAASKADAEKRLREATEESKKIRAQIAKEQSEHSADIEKRHRESVEDANRRKQESVTEANARLADSTEEAQRRVSEATDLANRRINHAADRVAALRTLRANIASQLASARSVLSEADVLLADAGSTADSGRQPGQRNGRQKPVPSDPQQAAGQEAKVAATANADEPATIRAPRVEQDSAGEHYEDPK